MALGLATYAMYSFLFVRYPPFSDLVTVNGNVWRIEETEGRYSVLEIELSGNNTTFIYPSLLPERDKVIVAVPRGSRVTLWVDRNDSKEGERVDIYQMEKGEQKIVTYDQVVQSIVDNSRWALPVGVCLFAVFLFLTWIALCRVD